MPVCLTGDVHHRSLRTGDQSILDRSEPKTAVEYAELVEDAGIDATLFLTGRTVEEDPSVIQRLNDFDCVEVGGHNYGAFTVPWVPRSGILFKGYRKAFEVNCPRWVQRRGIQKTCELLESVSVDRIVSWRDHGFNSDANTYELLASAGIRYVSDERAPDRLRPYKTSNDDLFEVPINVPPDHDHIRHGEIKQRADWSDPFSGDVYSGKEWLYRVLAAVKRIDKEGGLATILAHPACMALVDDFEVFARLCREVSKYETLTIREADEYAE